MFALLRTSLVSTIQLAPVQTGCARSIEMHGLRCPASKWEAVLNLVAARG